LSPCLKKNDRTLQDPDPEVDVGGIREVGDAELRPRLDQFRPQVGRS